jgi:hypothetical protein
MRKVFLIAGLMTAFAVAVVASSAAANFAGTWTLDKTKSQNLSPRMAGADKVTWTITQDAATLSIDTKVEGGQPPAGGGGGGGGMGGGGARPPAAPAVYKLDGSEVTSDMTFGQATGKQTLKATWAGAALDLSRKTSFTGQDGTERVSSETRKLSLSGDGKVLTAAVHSEGGRGGPSDSTLVFNK